MMIYPPSPPPTPSTLTLRQPPTTPPCLPTHTQSMRRKRAQQSRPQCDQSATLSTFYTHPPFPSPRPLVLCRRSHSSSFSSWSHQNAQRVVIYGFGSSLRCWAPLKLQNERAEARERNPLPIPLRLRNNNNNDSNSNRLDQA